MWLGSDPLEPRFKIPGQRHRRGTCFIRVLNMRNFIVVLLITTLYACGVTKPPTKGASDKSDNSKWVGRSIDELLVEKGEPLNIYTLERGGRTFEYLDIKTNTQLSASEANAEKARLIEASRLKEAVSGDSRWGRYHKKPVKESASDKSKSCTILFKISATDIIEGWAIEGKDCN